MQPVLLAVDGSGSQVQALVTDLDGRVLARGLGPSANKHSVGFDEFCGALTIAIEGALQHVLGPRLSDEGPAWARASIQAACFGLAGVDTPEDEEEVARWVRDRGITALVRVVNDSELILAAGTPEGWGIALISGTGSVCLGRSAEGRRVRVGGWGYMLGDEGSGYQIALKALRLATQTADGRADAAKLLQATLRHWSLPDANALIAHVHAPTMTPGDVAGLATAVVDLAARGDAPAQALIEEAAADLALHVDTVARRLGLQSPPLAFAGSLLRANLRNAVQAAIKTPLGPIGHVADPPLGAVVLARRLLKGPQRATV